MTSATPNSAPLEVIRPLPPKKVEEIFDRLTAQLGNKFADLWSGVKAEHIKLEWADGLAGFRGREIMRGLKACQTRVFAPTLGEFVRLCRPALDPEIAWLEARTGLVARRAGQLGEWSHPAVYRASKEMPYELTDKSFKECRKGWEWTLQREFDRGWGEDVPMPPLQLEVKPVVTRPPTAAERQAYAAIRAAGKLTSEA